MNRDRAERVGRARARGSPGRSPRRRVLPLGCAKRPDDSERGVHALAGRADRRAGGRSTAGAGVPGHHRRNSLADWDPPFPIDLSRVRPEDEKYWDDISNDAESVHPLRAGARAVGNALRRRDIAFAFPFPLALTRTRSPMRLRSEMRPLLSPQASGPDRHAGAAAGPRSIGRRDRLRRVLHLLQLLPRRLGAHAGGAVLPARHRAATASDRHPARRRLHDRRSAPAAARRGADSRGGRQRPRRRSARSRTRS